MNINWVLIISGVAAVGGGLIGVIARMMFDAWTNKINRRQELQKHVTDRIEKAAPCYYLMTNHSYLLSHSLNDWVKMKRQFQIESTHRNAEWEYEYRLKPYAESVGKDAIFYAGKLYRTITDFLWIDGGRYFLPDEWANQTIVDLHNGLMTHLRFDPNVLLKHIQTETQQHQFYEMLTKSEDDNELRELHDEYARYMTWLLKEDEEVVLVAAYATAYSNLFERQMERLYTNWYKRSFEWLFRWFPWLKSLFPRARIAEDAREAAEFAPLLNEETRELIERSVDTRNNRQQQQTHRIMSEISKDPKIIESNAHFRLGWAYYAAGQYDLAIQEYETAQRTQPDSAVIFNNIGNAYAGKEDIDTAVENYKKAILRDTKNAVFYANLGQAYNDQRQYTSAVTSYEKAIQCSSDDKPSKANYYYLLGGTYLASEQFDKAVGAYSEALTLAPAEPWPYNSLADAYFRLGRYESAIWACNQALSIEHRNSEALRIKINALSALGREDEAKQLEELLASAWLGYDMGEDGASRQDKGDADEPSKKWTELPSRVIRTMKSAWKSLRA